MKLKWLSIIFLLPGLCFATEKELSRKEKKIAKIARAALDKETIAAIGNLPAPKNGEPVEANIQFQFEQARILKEAKAIDVIISKKLAEEKGRINSKASDSLLVRRIYLDIMGRIPTIAELDTVLKSKQSDKISKLIDSLLMKKGHVSHQFNWFASMLRHKSSIKRLNLSSYERWLKDQIKTNRPWNELVHDLLISEGTLASDPRVGYLVRDRGMPLDSLSNTLTLFLGANVACAQCHDHPLADWTQREFYEMAAFFGSTSVGSLDPRKISKKISTKMGKGKLTKQDMIAMVAPNWGNVFTKSKQTLVYPDDYAYDDVKPGDAVEPYFIAWDRVGEFADLHQAKVSEPENLRAQFAAWLTDTNNPRFALNIANRLWKKLFGIAVQEPMQDLDDLSYASNRELIEHIGQLMRDLNFDLKAFQRVVMNTKAYQAKANPTPKMGDIDDYTFKGPVLRRMQAAQAYDSSLVLIGGEGVDQVEVDRSHAVNRFKMADFNFSEENLYKNALAMKASGYMNKIKDGKINYIHGVLPQKVGGEEMKRTSEIEQPARSDHFLRMFGQSSREVMDDESVEGNVPQTLMLMNGSLQKLIQHRDSLLIKRSAKEEKRVDQIQIIYKSFYGRKANSSELKKVSKAMDEGLSLGELSWVLFNTPEFLFIQ